MTMDSRTRWLALIVLCLGDLMIVLDTTIVNVALPSIRADLGFSQTSLAWVVNAYLLTFGGFLLLGGRLGDLFGHRRLFLSGSRSSRSRRSPAGSSTSQGMLVGARAVQGLGGAVVSAVALSLIMVLFTEPAERAKAMGVFGFVMAGGGSIGVLLGGVLTNSLDWHWIFLVNLPIGVARGRALAAAAAGRARRAGHGRVDVAGAVTVTAALMLAVYAIVNGNQTGWTSAQTLGLLGVAAALLARVRRDRVAGRCAARCRSGSSGCATWRPRTSSACSGPRRCSRGSSSRRSISSSCSATARSQVGLAFLPANMIMGAFSLGLSAKLVHALRDQAAARRRACCSPLPGSCSSRARRSTAASLVDVLPSMILLGFGAGMAFNPMLLAAMSDVEPEESGLASGVVNTAFMMGGALGLAVLASLAASRTDSLRVRGAGTSPR